MEETDGCPGCADGARGECGRTEDRAAKLVERRDRRVVECLVLWEGEDSEDDSEESGKAREGPEPVGEVCPGAGRIVWMKKSARKRGD